MKRLLLTLAACLQVTALAFGQGIPGLDDTAGLPAGPRLSITAKLARAARAGEVVDLVLQVRLEPGWHIYGAAETAATPTELRFDAKALAKSGLRLWGDARIPPGKRHEKFGLVSHELTGEVEIRQSVLVSDATKPGKLVLAGELAYMACTSEMCDEPTATGFEAELQVQAGAPRDEFVPRHVRITAGFAKKARAGETAVLELDVSIQAGWHIYGGKQVEGVPTKITVTDAAGLKLGEAKLPDGEPHKVPGLEETDYWLKGKAKLVQSFVVPKDANPGEREVVGQLDYMPCTDSMCEPPTFLTFRAKLTVEAGAARAQPAKSGGDPKSSATGGGKQLAGGAAIKNELAGTSLWLFLLAAIGGGLIALIMPCTYPMIPITMSFFTKQAEARGGRVTSLALTYGLGIVLIFVLIGLVIGPAIVPFATHAITNIVIAVLFFAFALSLFGVFTLQPPRFLMNFAGKASMRGGYFGVFMMGATLVVTSFTCTAPFVGNVLALGATDGSGRVALGMAAFGLTMAIPFVALALVPGRLSSLPRSGEWMNTLKVTLGFVEIAAALKFVSNADLAWNWRWLSRELFLTLWAGIFLIAGIYLLGMIRFKGENGDIGPGRLVGGLSMILFGFYCGAGALGNRLDATVMAAMAPPYSNRVQAAAGGGATGAESGRSIIEDDYEKARQLAIAQGKRLFVNFTGDT